MDLVDLAIVKLPTLQIKVLNLKTFKEETNKLRFLLSNQFKWNLHFACIYENNDDLVIDIESCQLPNRQLLPKLEDSLYKMKGKQLQDFAIALNTTNFYTCYLFTPTNSSLTYEQLCYIFYNQIQHHKKDFKMG